MARLTMLVPLTPTLTLTLTRRSPAAVSHRARPRAAYARRRATEGSLEPQTSRPQAGLLLTRLSLALDRRDGRQ